MLELNKLHLMDCMDGMKEFPDKYFDLAIVDPPYGIGIGTMTYTRSVTNARDGSRYWGNQAAERKDYSKKEMWDIRPTKAYFDELFRVSNRQIIWGGNYFSDMLQPSKTFIVWDKRIADYKNSFCDCEYAWCSNGMGVARMFRYMWNGMIQGNMKNKEERFHPTQKPIELYSWLLENYAKDGYKILDTHAGSASSLIACYEGGYDFVGFEIDSDYHKAANERLGARMAQTRLY